jgi:hypothetical protein
MSVENFISGEKFQALADVSIIPLGTEVGEKECGFVIDQQKNNNYNVFYYDLSTDTLPDYVQKSKTIFVNTWTLNKFFRTIFPLLTGEYIFISHNSDISFTEEYAHYLNEDKVLCWYSQNISIKHPKLFAIPIGIANQQYEHGNIDLLSKVLEGKYLKTNLVFKNFDVHTNLGARSQIDLITRQNNILMSPRTDQTNYLTSIAKSFFCISPPGNGVDCHRVWECLYLKTVPVIRWDVCYEQFKHLPILFIDDWCKVTKEFLSNQIPTFTNLLHKNLSELDINYWKNKILNTQYKF